MKFIIIIFSLFLFINSTQKKSEYFIPQDFEFPDDSIGMGKTFSYHDSLNNDDYYEDLRLIQNETKKLKSTVYYSKDAKTDSTIYYNGNISESYMNLSTIQPMCKGYNIDELIINKNGGKEKHIKQVFNNNIVQLTKSSIRRITNDTSIFWMGNYHKCLVIKAEQRVERVSPIFPSLNYDQEATVCFFYAKEFGVIKFIIHYTDGKNEVHHSIWLLSGIHDLVSNSPI